MARKITQAERNIPQTRRKLTPQEISAQDKLLGVTRNVEGVPIEPTPLPGQLSPTEERTMIDYGTLHPTQVDIMRKMAGQIEMQPSIEANIPHTISEEQMRQINAELTRQPRPVGREIGRTTDTKRTFLQALIQGPEAPKDTQIAQGTVPIGFLTSAGISGRLAATTSKSSILGKLGLVAIASSLITSEIKDFITGSDSRTLANEYETGIINTMKGVEAGSIEPFQAQSDLNRYVSQLNELEGSFHLGLRQLIAQTDSGRRFIENIKNALITADRVQFQLNQFAANQQALKRQQMIQAAQF